MHLIHLHMKLLNKLKELLLIQHIHFVNSLSLKFKSIGDPATYSEGNRTLQAAQVGSTKTESSGRHGNARYRQHSKLILSRRYCLPYTGKLLLTILPKSYR
ncbi:hypothetical protein KC19_9G055800 [Ceratodon purpureus]|uniref:Uncharacterized protein n=1 Tax=Ceratodon purpureus TaxID=3225 RepID=A0A8T0GSI7_CERPU|nr:hypothetical protein KC19_9G055800 [Ceratodon purpureus]